MIGIDIWTLQIDTCGEFNLRICADKSSYGGGNAMKEKKRGYRLLTVFTIILTLGAIGTLSPIMPASKECMLGYMAHCSFTPISTIICIAGAAVVCIIRNRKFTVSG